VRLRLSPGDTVFYNLFTASAQNVREGVRLLAEALADDADRAAVATSLKEIEHKGR